MAGGVGLLVGLALVAAVAGRRRRGPAPSPAPSPSTPVDPWAGVPEPTEPVSPPSTPTPSGEFGGPVCDPMQTPIPGFVCVERNGVYRREPKNPETFAPDLFFEDEVVQAVVTEWTNAQPKEIVLCDGTVRVAERGVLLSDWLTNIAYWLAYRGLAGNPCPPRAAPEVLETNPTSVVWEAQTPYRDSWLRLNQAIRAGLQHRYISDTPL